MTCAWVHQIANIWSCDTCGAVKKTKDGKRPTWCPLKTMIREATLTHTEEDA